MSSLDEAFMNPLQNSNGVFKPLSGNRRRDFVQIIADLMEMMFNCHFRSQFTDRYSRQLSEQDRNQYARTAFGRFGIRDGFEQAIAKELRRKGMSMRNVVPMDQKYTEASYYELSNGYFKRVVGIGPYRTPVWLLDDE